MYVIEDFKKCNLSGLGVVEIQTEVHSRDCCAVLTWSDCKQFRSVTFPLVLDVVLHVEVDGDVGPHARRPAFANVGLGHLHDGKGSDGLGHPGPAAKHHSAVLGLPVGVCMCGRTDRKEGDSERCDKCRGALSSLK